MKGAKQHIVVPSRASVVSRLQAPAILFVLVVLFNWKLVLTNQFTWLESPDLSALTLPWFQYQAGLWHHGHFPLWNPNSWFGMPLIGQGEPGAAYPLNWLLFLVPLKHGWIRQAALHWYMVVIHYFAALTCYALARELGRSRAASIIAGCVYALGGYVASVTWPQMVNGAVWTPLVFLYLLRCERGQRPWASAVLSGFFLGAGWLAGHHQMNLLVSIAAAGLWLWLILRDGKFNRQMARLAVCSMAAAILASGLQTVPLAEYGRLAVRWAGPDQPLGFNETIPYSVHEEYALAPVQLLGIVMPNIQQTFSPFIGIAAFSLGILGAMLAWKHRQVRWLAAIGACGLLYSLGPASLLHGALYALVPLVEKARVPAAGILVFAVGFAPLVAYGVDLLPQPESFSLARRAGWWLLAVAAVLCVIEMLVWAAKATGGTNERVMIPALAAAAVAVILAAWRAGSIAPRAGTVACLAIVLFELANVTNYDLPHRNIPAQNPYLSHLAENGDLAAFIRNRGIAARAAYDQKEIAYNFGDWYDIETSTPLDATALANVWNMDLFSPREEDFLGVRYYLGKTAPRPEFVEAFSGRSGLKVFENRKAFPRVWSAHQAVSLPDAASLAQARRAAAFDARSTVLLAGEPAPALAACQSSDEDVEMPYHGPNQLTITADLKCRGMVILTDAWFPGWRATVDGKPARIYQVYGGVRGVVAEAGRHVIEMKYRPWSVMLGAMMTMVACFLAALAGLGRIPFHAH
jgi:hypothetical protein